MNRRRILDALLFRSFLGKLLGSILGFFSGMGLFGAAVGALIGHFIDQIVIDRYIVKRSIDYFRTPGESPLPDRVRILIALGAMAGYAAVPDETIAGRRPRQNLRQAATPPSLTGRQAAILVETAEAFLDSPRYPIEPICADFMMVTGKPDSRTAMEAVMKAASSLHGKTPSVTSLRRIAGLMRLDEPDFLSLKNSILPSDAEAYDILGVSPDAPTTEIRKVYRSLASRFHPDRGAALEPELMHASEEAFIRIREAYERIMRERGLS